MITPKDKIPKRYLQFIEQYPGFGNAYYELGGAVPKARPLNDKNRALIKVALLGVGMLERAFHLHIIKAIKAGASKEKLQHVSLLSIPTIGFPSMKALMSWIEDIFKN